MDTGSRNETRNYKNGDLTSYSTVKDREGRGMGVVIGMPGYEPLYVGAALDSNNDGNLSFRFSPPE
ncbi:hypothetical protein KIN20_030699 [Parelaphostrongylus tenuis]|uniref:Uncharacterized protein n=1 Tax=Parelaphostrongylus tenuis TaxID=148309 RepID=A0AAD5R4I3_PARTN|nr:hypothetical protein KIN20_030699 [Parelaphostrongylus tenuis]